MPLLLCPRASTFVMQRLRFLGFLTVTIARPASRVCSGVPGQHPRLALDAARSTHPRHLTACCALHPSHPPLLHVVGLPLVAGPALPAQLPPLAGWGRGGARRRRDRSPTAETASRRCPLPPQAYPAPTATERQHPPPLPLVLDDRGVAVFGTGHRCCCCCSVIAGW